MVVKHPDHLLPQAKREERMSKPVSEVVKMVGKKEIDPWVQAIVFELCCNDTEGEDVEVSEDSPIFVSTT